ncbi:DUF6531 domain-containing protein [Paraburkholderia bonniea]|uniref:DUF6531 domain-containing protein n=1 Tax=Paraburkholderia bonniea TaxID=2152891 RepID=UPI0024846846|nr:DUF6531 domain-containing protein [Paraburkholderia bonniea]
MYPGSGAVTLTEADFVSGDDLPLYFTRTYRSKPRASNASAMGPAWFHSWQRHLDLTNANHSRTAKVLAYRENGEPITFNWNAGAWRTPGFTGLALTRNGSESGNANEAAWTLTNLQTDTTESYSAQGVLLTESTRTGFVRTLSYDSSGLLSTITQHAIGTDARKDITLRLDYDDKRRLSRLNDPLGRLTQSLSAYKGSGDFAVIVLNPDPFNYFHFHFGKHPGFIIEANRSDNDFFEILMKDPGDSPADVIGFYSEQYVVLPLSGEWFMYADRGWDWGTGVLITGPPDVMNVARQAFAFYENPG